MNQQEKVAEVVRRLSNTFGPIQHRPSGNPLDLLVRTILSQNTSDRNRDLAYAELRRRFPTWEDVVSAPVEEVEKAIHAAGLHRQRAIRIQTVLQRIQDERGELCLDFLAELSDEEAKAWLLSLPGVGKKTAYVVLLFGFDRRFFPVDTHIQRVTERLGLLPVGEEPHTALAPLIPPGKEMESHLNLIRLGREFCRARQPRCPICPLADICDHFSLKEVR